MQAAIASTTKSDSRAWRPGAQNCNTSIAPVIESIGMTTRDRLPSLRAAASSLFENAERHGHPCALATPSESDRLGGPPGTGVPMAATCSASRSAKLNASSRLDAGASTTSSSPP